MHDDTDRFIFPDLPDDAVVAINGFLEDFYTAFQNHYFAHLHRCYHQRDQRPPDDGQMPLPFDPAS